MSKRMPNCRTCGKPINFHDYGCPALSKQMRRWGHSALLGHIKRGRFGFELVASSGTATPKAKALALKILDQIDKLAAEIRENRVE